VLGTWAGLCKIDREGNPRKIVGCSCVVVKDYGVESEGMHVLLDYFRNVCTSVRFRLVAGIDFLTLLAVNAEVALGDEGE
jgi:hypothetical protein